MPKVSFGGDEWYPVYSVEEPSEDDESNFEVTDEQIARWNLAMEIFGKAQEEIGELVYAREEIEREKQRAARIAYFAEQDRKDEERKRLLKLERDRQEALE